MLIVWFGIFGVGLVDGMLRCVICNAWSIRSISR